MHEQINDNCVWQYICVFLYRKGEEGFCWMMKSSSCCADSFINEEFDASDHTSVVIFADWFLTSSTGPLTL